MSQGTEYPSYTDNQGFLACWEAFFHDKHLNLMAFVEEKSTITIINFFCVKVNRQEKKPFKKLDSNSRTESQQDNTPGVSRDQSMIQSTPDPSVKRCRKTRLRKEGKKPK